MELQLYILCQLSFDEDAWRRDRHGNDFYQFTHNAELLLSDDFSHLYSTLIQTIKPIIGYSAPNRLLQILHPLTNVYCGVRDTLQESIGL